ncbi:MAG: Alanine racemase [Candidatus Uhrbacteria bacterium GW2011_GWE2_45_35]|uniref:Alanine racemase n=2 Tax=Candidatus Uhriibacteriota TaxID=1752732 RepID=A0A0G1MJ68_9BACT|nr:MAG: Alanine racemase [Candidatus Uhrbacteria bacterium GW2011_GWF2_44_350]KKU09096.1 MAG: Alanine racemase [Candidatus Uhrbacteria bacterium GW2011_GWE2_45_35]
MAVVKANAYGHGLIEVSNILHSFGVEVFGVDNFEDALLLRQHFSEVQIVVLGYVLKKDLTLLVKSKIELVVYNFETVKILNEAGIKSGQKARVHLKVETGTSRQGVLLSEVNKFIDLLRQMSHVELVGLSTHFATAEEGGDNKFLVQQLEEFEKAEHQISKAGFSLEHIHCACSAAIILRPETQKTLVRAGLAMYGVWPSEKVKLAIPDCELKPVLSWKSRLAQIKELPAGTSVGYARTSVLEKTSRVAVVPVGYFDGYDRGLSSLAEVLVHGKRCQVLGRVCMNMMMINVTEVPEAKIEDEVILLGQGGEDTISIEELSNKAQTIPYEFLARLRQDLPRIVL